MREEMRPVVYVSGPITLGNSFHNVHNAAQAAWRLVEVGFAPIVPQLTALWDMIAPMEYDDWMTIDKAIVLKADVLVRLPGESKGADMEVAHANTHGVLVTDVDTLSDAAAYLRSSLHVSIADSAWYAIRRLKGAA